MKKHITFLLCCVLILFSLAGCSRYHAGGRWEMRTGHLQRDDGASWHGKYVEGEKIMLDILFCQEGTSHTEVEVILMYLYLIGMIFRIKVL